MTSDLLYFTCSYLNNFIVNIWNIAALRALTSAAEDLWEFKLLLDLLKYVRVMQTYANSLTELNSDIDFSDAFYFSDISGVSLFV